MENTNNNPSHKRRSKCSHFEPQMQRVFAAFERGPATMLMISIETGVLRANICRYVAEWEQQGQIYLYSTGICQISKHRAGFYTTNPELFTAIVEPSNTVKP